MKTLIAVMLGISCVVPADEIAGIREYSNQVMEHLDDEYGLYRTEEVVFQYVLSHGWDNNITEYRWWYAGGELIQSSASTAYPEEVVEFIPEGPEAYEYVYTP